MKLSKKQNADRVQIEVVVLDDLHGWDTQMVWVPRELAKKASQDAFIEWVYSDDGASWRNTWDAVTSVYVYNFRFEETGDDSIFVDVGSKVRIVRASNAGQVGLPGQVGQVGDVLTAGRIGPDSGNDLIDIRLPSGDEVTAYSHQLDEHIE